MTVDDAYTLIGCMHGLHAAGPRANAGAALPGGAVVQPPMALALCSALASVILQRPQDDAIIVAGVDEAAAGLIHQME